MNFDFKNIPSIQTVKLNNLNFASRALAENRVNNQRYTVLSFIPMILFDQFKYFFNMFFLAVCLS
jgi:phospholipid-translocating ATPase